MKHKVEFNLWNIRQQLQMATGEEHSYRRIARFVSSHHHTIENMASNKSQEKLRQLLGELLDYFQAEGLDITIADLFTVTVDEDAGHD